MKMPTLPKMKMPKLPKLPKPQPKRLQATARRAAQPAMDDYDEEPTTRLSSAFIVVLILHVVAVGGIYAFNSIKANRRGAEIAGGTPLASKTTEGAPAAPTVEKAVNTTGGSGVTIPAAALSPSTTKYAPISGSRVYHVRSGDTLSKVALQNGVTIEDLQEANGLKTGTEIRVGQTLNIPAPSQRPSTGTKNTSTAADNRKSETVVAKKQETTPKAAATASATKTYTVKKGDNPVLIAKKHGVAYEELLRLNKIDDPRKLRIDQVLKIPAKKD